MKNKLTRMKALGWWLPVLALFLTALLAATSGFNGLYGQDSHEYYRYTIRWVSYFQNGNSPGDYFWPLNYPLYGAVIGLMVDTRMALQVISMISFAISIYLIQTISNKIYRQLSHGSILILLLAGISPFFLLHGLYIMSDMFGALWCLLVLYLAVRYREENDWRLAGLAVFAMSSAVMTRYAAALLLFPIAIMLLSQVLRRRDFRSLVAMAAGLVALLPHFIVRSSAPEAFLGHSWLQQWSMAHFFQSQFTTVDGFASYRFPNLLYAFGPFYYPGFLFVGVFVIAFLRPRDWGQPYWQIIAISVVLYCLFLAGIPFQNYRFLIIAFPFTVILLLPAASRIAALLAGRRSLVVLMTVLLLTAQGFLFNKYSRPIFQLNQFEQHAAESLRLYPPVKLYTFSLNGALQSYQIPQQLVNLWASEITNYPENALLLYHPQKFAKQWAQKQPQLNWQYLNSHYHLQTLETIGDGWYLYRIGSRLNDGNGQ